MFTIGRNFHAIHMTDDLGRARQLVRRRVRRTGGVLEQLLARAAPARVARRHGRAVHRADAAGVRGRRVGQRADRPVLQTLGDQLALDRLVRRRRRGAHRAARRARGRRRRAARAPRRQARARRRMRPKTGRSSRIRTARSRSWSSWCPTPKIPDPRPHPAFRPCVVARRRIRCTSARRRTSRCATRDLDAAADLYVDVIGGTVLHEGENDLLRTRSTFVAVGPRRHRRARGAARQRHTDRRLRRRQAPRPVLGVAAGRGPRRRDGAPAVEGGRSRRWRTRATFLSDPATTHGVHWGVTTASIPGDTRADW